MPVKHISVTEAHELLESAEGYVYVDVRSIPEYLNGHPAGAVNVPLLHFDQAQQRMVPNAEFLDVVAANFPKDARLLVGCQMGGRSAKAAEMLAQSGYAQITNVRGGFGGMRDQMSGAIVEPGWSTAGLPVEQGNPSGRSYEDLRKKS